MSRHETVQHIQNCLSNETLTENPVRESYNQVSIITPKFCILKIPFSTNKICEIKCKTT